VNDTVADLRTALPHERVADLIREARRITVEHCPCRTRERRCDHPTETCLGLDEVADYMAARGIGREIGVEEAFEILARCEAEGLLHLAENGEHSRVICNCCTCCCVFLRAMSAHGKTQVVSPSRYMAVVDGQACTACGTCETRCAVDAIRVRRGAADPGLGDATSLGGACVDTDSCLGCGLCASTCASNAITLTLRHPGLGLPHRGSGFAATLALPDTEAG
jgi:ferredoxin